MLVYISGKITGNYNYVCDFMNAELKIKEAFPDATIVNPINTTGCNSWVEYMRKDLSQLLNCNTIYMIKGWRRSKGAKLEYKIARALGMKIIYDRW